MMKRLLLIPIGLTALVLLWLLWLTPAAAATVTMTKAGGGNWSDPTLWNTGAVPAADDTVIIAATETAQVAVDVPVTVARLEVLGASVSKWQTVTVTGQSLTVTGDLLLRNYAKLYQGAGGQVTAGRFFVGSAASGRVAWETRGTASQRARVASPSGGINVNTDPANGGSATAGSAIEQDIQWNYTDFALPGGPTVLPLAGTNSARLQVDHCYWDNTGYLDFGQWARGATLLEFTHNDVRLRGSNPNSRKANTSAMLTLKRNADAAPTAVDRLQGNVITWIPATNETAFVYLYSAGGAGRVWDNVFQDISLNLTFTSEALIEPNVFDVAGNLFFLTESVLIPGAEIQSRYGSTIRDNLFMARSINSHIIKLSSAIQGPPDTVTGNVFDVADPDADIIMLGHSSATITQNLFLGGGTPINMGLTATNDAYRNLVDLDSSTGVVSVRRNTVYTRGAAAISGFFIWEGETSYHGGTVTIANNIAAEWSYNALTGMESEDFRIGQVYPNSVDWTDYTWWWNDGGGTLDRYFSITMTGRVEGDLGFGMHDQEGDPHFKNKSARVLTMDAYLQGTPQGDEMRALAEFKKRNENVPGEIYIPQYNVPVALSYLRAAFTPMNLALNDAGLDGEDIGAIDMTSLPATPSAPTLVSGTVTSLTLEWPEPPGSVVGDYDLQYRLAGAVDWTDYAISYIEFLKNLQNYAKTTATGLETGAAYEFRVRAGNGLGYSAWSPASAALIVMGPPGLPTGLSALGLDRAARLAFTAPVNTGGVALTGYTVTVSPGGLVVQGTESPLTIPNLLNSVSYTLALTASNAGYTGPAATVTVTPHEPLPPAAPELLTLRRAPGQAFDWGYQFAVAPTAPGETCIEGQHAWDDTYLWTCIPGGRWVYVQPNKFW
jgi:hypothetical protein